MERTDWLEQGYDSAEARFLMLTAITHHQFDSPVWGQEEVRRLHLELTEIDLLTTRAAVEHAAGRASGRLAGAFLGRARTVRAQPKSTANRGHSVGLAAISRGSAPHYTPARRLASRQSSSPTSNI